MAELFERVDQHSVLPTKGSAGAAGYDLYAHENVEIIGCAGVFTCRTGVRVKIPPGHYGRIAMRSGLAVNQSLAVSAGVIDRDYTGELIVCVYMPKAGATYQISRGNKFAQLIIEKIYGCDNTVESTTASTRGAAGFGSTGSM